MSKRKAALDLYKNAILAKYKIEKENGCYASFLITPSRAKLRDLCVERMKRNHSQDDAMSFRLFTDFDFEQYNTSKMSKTTDKFRPIGDFYLGKSDLMDLKSIEMAAILVNFQQRPFKKYVSLAPKESDCSDDAEMPRDKIETPNSALKPMIASKYLKLKSYGKNALIFLSILSVSFVAKKIFFDKPECMIWKNESYILTNCASNVEDTRAEIVPYDAAQFKLKKVDVYDTTTFFIGKKPVYFYSKSDGKISFFNQPGTDPITGKHLKPVSHYIIEKYVKKSPKNSKTTNPN